MPELPEVETMARELRPYILGRTITAFWCDRPAILAPPAGIAALSGALSGRRILSVSRRGKIVLFGLSDGALLTYAPRMTGQFAVVPAGTTRGRHERAGLALSDGQELRIRDTRTFGRLAYYPEVFSEPANGGEGVRYSDARTGEALFAHLGPEPLDPRTDEITMSRLSARRWRGRAVKTALLDQGFLAGVGNIYADEALWTAKIHPQRPAGSLSPAEAQGLFAAVKEILTTAVEQRGSTVSSYRSLEGVGSMQGHLSAYGRAGRPCLRCGTVLSRLVVGGRGTVVCPSCQKL